MLNSIRNREVRRTKSARVLSRVAAGKATRFACDSGSRIRGDHRSIRLAEDIASAQLRLAEGAPIPDVLTMLEVRHRFDLSATDCRAYAVEILCAARELARNDALPIPNPKESAYAAA